MYTELLRLRRELPVLTDPAAQQHVSVVGDTILVMRSTPQTTATLAFHFGPSAVDHPAPDPVDAIAFDTDDERWSGPGWTHERLGPWSARLGITHAR
jgi:hypothetical protein